MSKLYSFAKLYIALAIFLFVGRVSAQIGSADLSSRVHAIQHQTLADSLGYNSLLRPFYHGVASGDPLPTQLIIWTRVTPDNPDEASLEVAYQLATDTAMTNVVSSGTFTTSADRDWTVKIDVTGLSPNTTYYYMFEALDRKSLIGRTKTAPTTDEAERLKFAVVSCSNYEAGFFNAYGRIADRNDLDAVVHLGDYFYEYAARIYGDTTLTGLRSHGDFETVTLSQYRARYSQYRLDNDLRRAHQQHPFIAIWDDHESANDAYVDGAENHQPDTEGDWNERKAISRKVYFEWMPIRDNEEERIYRVINYGNLADLIMLDTRLEGRQRQLTDVTDSALVAEDRTLLGVEQKEWLLDQLASSEAKWKVIGNQVIFSILNVGFAGLTDPSTSADEFESFFLDIWDGYPVERQQIIDFIDTSAIDNVIILSGDFHSSFAFDVADTVTTNSILYTPSPNYDRVTGEGSVAVEFVTPSISSANFDENLDKAASDQFEALINAPFQPFFDNPNPHMKHADLDQHGYFILDLKSDTAQADWYYVDRLDTVSSNESFGIGMYTLDGNNHLDSTLNASAPKAIQQIPAPALPLDVSTSVDDELAAKFAVMGVYPNPLAPVSSVQYAVERGQNLSVEIIDLQGRLIAVLTEAYHQPGVYELFFKSHKLAPGIYQLSIKGENASLTRKVSVLR